MSFLSKILTGMAVGVLSVAPLSVASPAAAAKLIFGHAGPEFDSQHIAALAFKKAVEERSKGALTVEIFPGSVLGNDQAMIAGAQQGSIDIEMSGSPNFTGLSSKMGVLDLPFLFSGAEQAHKTLDGPVGQSLLGTLDAKGLKGLAFWEVGFRVMTNARRPITTPADLVGMKIRTTPNPYHLKAFQLLGASPMPMPLSELYSALETGVVDAQEHPLGIFWSAKFYEVQGFLSLTRHAYTPMVVVMNAAKFAGLPADLQTIVVDAAKEGSALQRKLNADNEKTMIADIRAKGVKVIETPDMAPFRDKVAKETRDMFIAKNGAELLQAIDAAP